MAPKKHHFVPQAILRKFCFRGETLYYYYKGSPQKGVHERNITSVFMRKHLYSYSTKSGDRNTNLEIWFATFFDNHIKPLTEKWENMVVGKNPFSISDEDRHYFVRFLYNLMKRTPDFHQPFFEKNMTEEEFEEALREAEGNYGPISEQDRKQFKENAKTENYKSKVRVNVLAGQSSKILNLMESKGILLATPESKNKQFIVASNPVTNFLGKRNTDMWDPSYEVWVTLSPRLAVCLTQTSKESRTMALSDANVRKLNLRLAKQSRSFAGANRRLIESLAKQA